MSGLLRFYHAVLFFLHGPARIHIGRRMFFQSAAQSAIVQLAPGYGLHDAEVVPHILQTHIFYTLANSLSTLALCSSTT